MGSRVGSRVGRWPVRDRQLTDVIIRRMTPLPDRDLKLPDGRGLYLLVRPSGSRLWRHKYRFGGQERTASYGPYPEVTLKEARERCDATRAMLRDGLDPRTAGKTLTTSTGHTLESLAREWHELNRERWVPHHAADVIGSLEKEVFPHIGAADPAALDPPAILAVLRRIEARGAIETASRVRQRLAAVYAYGMSAGLLASNPAETVRGALRPIVKKGRQPAVTDIDRLRDLLRAAEATEAYPVTLLASRFLALTVQRPGTVRQARWEDMLHIDWESDAPSPDALWHIPAELLKLKLERKGDAANDHLVPLAPQAVEVLRAVRALTGRLPWVFAGQRHAHRPLSENAIGYLYNRTGAHGRHVPHGWRAAFSTVMNERRPGDRAVIDAMLAHTAADKVEAAYNRAQRMAARREIACEWAGLISEGLLPPAELLTVERCRRDAT
ncbi:DUF4102 domain-containing protein [Erythrobacteraceae bacterium CFH 75059]|uniref:tyrosine-type recombinase/integrase n=1 Tax=Qipengyuania thermophila TaxID=2509361 RepID=UPI00101EDF6D|nr:integrase arm-type DNA-binding domain-containing protein [Qipengyuania thermophila]TCD04289.1 DUF4102 domain-containing protein [Erythrobacteraceae bacterium CFH 75059]